MRFLASHPFLSGFVTAVVLVAIHLVLPSGALTLSQRRALGLVVFGGLFVVLGRAGMDRDDSFWVFVGGVCGLLLTLPILLPG